MSENRQGVKYTDEELNALPEDEKKRILLARKERKQKLQETANIDLEELQEESISDREYNSKFSKVYTYVRKGLVVLAAKKKTGGLIGVDLWNETLELIENARNF